MDWSTIIEDSLRAAVGREAIIYALAAIGLNVHFGYTGLLNFGQVGFMAVGAYGVAISVLEWGLPLGVGRARRHRRGHRCSPFCSACRRCGCAPTTWPSSPSPPARSSAS